MTRPLQVNRIPTPTNSTSPRVVPPNTAPTGPARPQRSELRSRNSEYSDRTSYSNRDSISTTTSDVSTRNYRNGATNNPPTPLNARPRLNRLRTAPGDDDPISPSQTTASATPTSLASAMSAFQSAGSRRRAMTNDGDFDYQREREIEMEQERARQQRIRDRVPGRRVNGRARAGDIDGLSQIKYQSTVLNQFQLFWTRSKTNGSLLSIQK